ncbi:hypothetical protein HQ590_14905 [bacterium]|nr:hypothetical protein [bacterium]
MTWTLCLVLDQRTLGQLRGVWPTWCRHKPEIQDHRLVVICDWAAGNDRWWRHQLRWLDHPNLTIVGWDWPASDDSEMGAMTQRERMLTAWVRVPPMVVNTDYWLKIDTDVVATRSGPWVLDEWFADKPAIVAPRWGYTKPATLPGDLDRWARTVPALKPLRSLDLAEPDPGQKRIGHRRICSWFCFVDTLFSRTAADYAPGRLPVPSQDTYHWYVAWRCGEGIRRIKPKNHGWKTVNSDRGRARLVTEVLGPHQEEGCCG